MLNINVLDRKLVSLFKEEESVDSEISEIYEEIEELEMRRDCLEGRRQGIKHETKSIKENMLGEVNCEIENKFLRDFIMASWFCNWDKENSSLGYVRITDDRLIALDGYKVVIIKTEIAKELRNTFIKWDIRENFEKYTENIEGYPDITKIIEGAEKNSHIYPSLITEEFYKKFDAKQAIEDCSEEISYYSYAWLIKCGDVEVCFNKEYLDSALMAFKDSKFTLKIGGELDPLLLENERIKAMVLPMRRRK